MRLLIEAHHPAHIHFWKYPVRELLARGHSVLMVGRDRDVMRRLLAAFDWIPAEIPRAAGGGNRFPVAAMVSRQLAVAGAVRRFRPDLVASLMGSYSQCARLLGVRTVVFTDSEFQHFNHRIAHPFAHRIFTPECFYKDLGPKQRRYPGIHELVFIREPAPLPPAAARPRMLIRLSAWNTLHDVRARGIGDRVFPFIERFRERYDIVVSAEEGRFPPGLEDRALAVAPEDYLDALGGSAFVLSEGTSTASEAACLGVPTVCVNSTEERGYLRLLENDFGLVRGFRDPDAGMAAAAELAGEVDDAMRAQWREKALALHARFPRVDTCVVDLLLGECGKRAASSSDER